MARITKHRVLILSIVGGLFVMAIVVALLIVQSKQHVAKKAASPTVTSTVKPLSSVTQTAIKQADTQAAAGDTASAVKSLNEAASHATAAADKEAYYTKAATLLVTDGQPEAAVTAMRSAINTDPNNWQLYENLGYVYKSIGDNPSAITAFQQALTLIKQNPPAANSSENSGQAEIVGQLKQLGVSS